MKKISRPLFTWMTVENTVDTEGTFTNQTRAVLVTDVDAAKELVNEIGARQWRLLESLAWHSHSDAAFGGRRLVRATIPELATLAGGSDAGWSESTISPVLKAMETQGLLIRIVGKRLGRSKGQEKTAFLLADGLFARPSTRAQESPQNTGTEEKSPQLYEPQKPSPLKTTTNEGEYDPQELRVAKTEGPHGNHGMEYSSMHSMAILSDETACATVVAARMRELGWTSDVEQAIRIHSLARLAAWIIWIENATGVRSKGAVLRHRLNEGKWPEDWQPGTIVETKNGRLHALTPQSQEATVPTMKELQTILDTLPLNQVTFIQQIAAQAVSSAGGINLEPAERSKIWRKTANELLNSKSQSA